MTFPASRYARAIALAVAAGLAALLVNQLLGLGGSVVADVVLPALGACFYVVACVAVWARAAE